METAVAAGGCAVGRRVTSLEDETRGGERCGWIYSWGLSGSQLWTGRKWFQFLLRGSRFRQRNSNNTTSDHLPIFGRLFDRKYLCQPRSEVPLVWLVVTLLHFQCWWLSLPGSSVLRGLLLFFPSRLSGETSCYLSCEKTSFHWLDLYFPPHATFD